MKESISKKEELVHILESLFDHWDLARGLHLLVQTGPMDDTMINGLLQIIHVSIQDVHDEAKRAKLESAQAQLLSMREMEAIERISEIENATPQNIY